MTPPFPHHLATPRLRVPLEAETRLFSAPLLPRAPRLLSSAPATDRRILLLGTQVVGFLQWTLGVPGEPLMAGPAWLDPRLPSDWLTTFWIQPLVRTAHILDRASILFVVPTTSSLPPGALIQQLRHGHPCDPCLDTLVNSCARILDFSPADPSPSIRFCLSTQDFLAAPHAHSRTRDLYRGRLC